ncbi:general substrate transporter [Lipomyces starkeyi]|uniref:Major facilitator superfamily (MFS) profile domain-containing protein n=1 Tax=Lipomyces starkeyi NRRL Y-11557 TaxID=675824 RepID=A0A1E3Q2P5_LIPST|nr:hypothetical protein LIPSTDRAFT_322949 [Lipomyces starkeyi NRRL Y-11557]
MVRLLNVYTISSFVALGGVLYGFDVASMSGIVGTHQYKAYYGNPLGATQGCITGAIAAGSLVGALCSAVLGDWMSRKVAIQLGTIAWCVGASLQAASNGVALLIMGRIVAGFCIGVTSALIPIYQSEIAPRKIRGRIVSLQHFAICLGILIQYFVQYGCSFLDSQAVFRLPWALQTMPAILLFIGLFWLPRSPRWLASKDRWDEVLQWIYPPEIVPLRIRAKTVSFSTATNWVTSFALSVALPPLLRAIRWHVFVIFGCLNVAAFIHVWFVLPETKQRTLEEMDEIFEHGDPAWRSFTGLRYKTSHLDTLAREIEQDKLDMHRPRLSARRCRIERS